MKFIKPMMDTAYVWAEMSSCIRKKVGAVLEKDGRILSVGYNGTISGTDNKCEKDCLDCNGSGTVSSYEERRCESCQGKGIISNPNVVHAEKNLIAFCAKNGIATEGCTVYVTYSPCTECAQLMKQSGIVKVIYDEAYRDLSGVELLNSVGVDCKPIKDLIKY